MARPFSVTIAVVSRVGAVGGSPIVEAETDDFSRADWVELELLLVGEDMSNRR